MDVNEDAAIASAPPHAALPPSLPAPPISIPIPQDVTATVPNLGLFTHTTAMCWAAAEGHVEMMRKLREHGADVNAADYDKRCVRVLLDSLLYSALSAEYVDVHVLCVGTHSIPHVFVCQLQK